MPSPTQSNQIQAQAGEPTKMERPTYHIVFHWDPNTGIQQMGLAKIDKAEADWYAARTHLAFVATIPGSASSSPSSKQEDDPANYPDPRFKWDGKPVEVRGSVVWFKPADGNGEHGWPQFNPYEAKRLALFINSAIAPKSKHEDDREWRGRCHLLIGHHNAARSVWFGKYGLVGEAGKPKNLRWGIGAATNWESDTAAYDALAKAPRPHETAPPDSKPPTQSEDKVVCTCGHPETAHGEDGCCVQFCACPRMRSPDTTGPSAVQWFQCPQCSEKWSTAPDGTRACACPCPSRSIAPPTKPTQSVQSEPIKDLVEQARQISTPQSVQSEAEPSAIAKQITNKLWLKVIGMDNIRILAADIDAALKSANERAEAAEKELSAIRSTDQQKGSGQ